MTLAEQLDYAHTSPEPLPTRDAAVLQVDRSARGCSRARCATATRSCSDYATGPDRARAPGGAAHGVRHDDRRADRARSARRRSWRSRSTRVSRSSAPTSARRQRPLGTTTCASTPMPKFAITTGSRRGDRPRGRGRRARDRILRASSQHLRRLRRVRGAHHRPSDPRDACSDAANAGVSRATAPDALRNRVAA